MAKRRYLRKSFASSGAMALYFKLGIHKVWRACQKGKADFAFKPSDDLEAYNIILLMIMRKTKMARQAKSKVIESWLQWPPFIYRYHFFNCLIPLPALCSSTSKYHSSLCHFVQTRVIREHKPSHNPYTYAAQFQFLLRPTTSHFLPVWAVWDHYHLLFLIQKPFPVLSSTAASAKPGFMVGVVQIMFFSFSLFSQKTNRDCI